MGVAPGGSTNGPCGAAAEFFDNYSHLHLQTVSRTLQGTALNAVRTRAARDGVVMSEAGEMGGSLPEAESRDPWRSRRTERAAAPERGAGKREYASRDLLGDDREIVIRHGAETYRLRLTGNGKLLLTK